MPVPLGMGQPCRLNACYRLPNRLRSHQPSKVDHQKSIRRARKPSLRGLWNHEYCLHEESDGAFQQAYHARLSFGTSRRVLRKTDRGLSPTPTPPATQTAFPLPPPPPAACPAWLSLRRSVAPFPPESCAAVRCPARRPGPVAPACLARPASKSVRAVSSYRQGRWPAG